MIIDDNKLDSVTFEMLSPSGFGCLWTLRKDGGEKDFQNRVIDTEKKFKDLGFLPKPVKNFGGQFTPKKEPNFVPNRACPKCGSKLVKITTKNGKELTKCSTAKYDFKTKISSGCDYIEWGEEKIDPKVQQFDKEYKESEMPVPPWEEEAQKKIRLATPAQIKVISELYPDFIKAGLTYQEAQNIIVTNSGK
jgi:hypothetical protein